MENNDRIVHDEIMRLRKRVNELFEQKQELNEALKMLLKYAQIHEVTGVIYPEGSHKEWITKAQLALNKANGNG